MAIQLLSISFFDLFKNRNRGGKKNHESAPVVKAFVIVRDKLLLLQIQFWGQKLDIYIKKTYMNEVNGGPLCIEMMKNIVYLFHYNTTTTLGLSRLAKAVKEGNDTELVCLPLSFRFTS